MVIYENGRIDLFTSRGEINECMDTIRSYANIIGDRKTRREALQCTENISIPVAELRHLISMLEAVPESCRENRNLDRDRLLLLLLELGPEVMRESGHSLMKTVRTGGKIFEAEYISLLNLELQLRKRPAPAAHRRTLSMRKAYADG